jgi:urease accessory protein
MRLAYAHHFMENELPRTLAQGFLSGVGHPIIGLDHLAFIVATGFLLALVPGGWLGIAALIAGTLGGAALHLAGIDLPGGEAAIAVSVILIGALVMRRRSIAFPWIMGGLAVAGILHGHAYAESIFGAEPAPLVAYLVGFSLIQLAIALAAFFLHAHLPRAVVPVLGGLVAGIGVLFLYGSS